MNFKKINQYDLEQILSDKNQWQAWGLNPNKGYILIGNPGVGKTWAMRQEALTQKIGWGHPKLPLSQNQKELSAKFIFSQCEKQGPNYLNQFTQDHDMWLDDLGFEPTDCNSYGTKFSPIQDLIFYRHKLFPHKKTNFTSNLSHVQIKQKYGEAILSRLFEMCNFIVVEGQDRRLL